ncbi:helix-turn-helix domain-containing protein [Pelagibius litoralis]|uniref:Helix-turn-helix domain-containing protein n=1 Tax=Pelagibius litoralis TaxID=374515 RepID=A0A967C5N9_9PROT|nr:helix-turn-helix domain-containing protein [Pelagibius litoralis]
MASIPQTRQLLGGISDTSVWRLTNRGALEVRKIGSRTFITMTSIRRVAEQGAE